MGDNDNRKGNAWLHPRNTDTDIVQLSPELRRFVGDSDEAKYFLHLRDVLGRALMLHSHSSDPDGHARDAMDTRLLLAQLKSGGVQNRGDVIHDLAALDEELCELGDMYWCAPRDGDEQYVEAARRRRDDGVRRATVQIARWLGIPETPDRRWNWMGQGYLATVSDRVRGRDFIPRKRRASVPKPPKQTREEKAAARATERMNRVVSLLKRRYPDGLSGNAIKTALRMGDEEARTAIRAAMNTDVIVLRGSLENPRYYAAAGLPEKRPAKRSREER